MVGGFSLMKMLAHKKSDADHHERPESSENDDLIRQTQDHLTRLKRGDFDFVDLGTCDGGGFTIAEKQGGHKGLGFDLEPRVVRQATAKGLDVAFYDVCDLDIDKACVDFAICSHVLEHLPNLQHIENVLKSLTILCRDYVLISGPVFEDEDYLLGLGIKALHSLMLDHTCKMTVGELQSILQRLGCRDYLIALSEKIQDSSNIWLYSASQTVPPMGLWTYDPKQHLPKPHLVFDRALHRDFVCIVPLRSDVSCDTILHKFYWGYDKVVVRNTWAY